MIRVGIYGEKDFGVDNKRVRNVVFRTLKQHNIGGDVSVDVNFVGLQTITRLNRKYMKHQGATDVLSFPLEDMAGADGTQRLGDIVVCYPIAKNHEEVDFLVEHGCLHLLGIHHEE